jgi:osomolarity two-component system, sensor histidine kinase SLN1
LFHGVLVHMLSLALGVGKRAVIASKPLIDHDHSRLSLDCTNGVQSSPDRSSTRPSSGSTPPGRDVAGPITMPVMSPLATSALKTIMEQGSVPILSHAALNVSSVSSRATTPAAESVDKVEGPMPTANSSKVSSFDEGPPRLSLSVPPSSVCGMLDVSTVRRKSSDTAVGSETGSLPALPFSSASSSFPPTGSPALSTLNSRTSVGDGLHPLRVLIVDDDPLTRTLMSRLFVRLGCHVFTAENGSIALEQILATPLPASQPVRESPLTIEEAWAEEDARFSIVFLVRDHWLTE